MVACCEVDEMLNSEESEFIHRKEIDAAERVKYIHLPDINRGNPPNELGLEISAA